MYAPYIRSDHHIDEKTFRQRLIGRMDEKSPRDGLRHITIVGVNRPQYFGFGGMDEDSIRTRTLLDYLDRSGVGIDPEFVLDPVDFMLGRDFLREDHKTDLVIVSCILQYNSNGKYLDGAEHLARIGHAARYDPSMAFDLSTRLSDLQGRTAWQSRLNQSGAKLCITFGGKEEIDTEYLANEQSISLVETKPSSIPLWRDRNESTEHFYGFKNDLPMLWLGILARKDWILGRNPVSPERREDLTILGNILHDKGMEAPIFARQATENQTRRHGKHTVRPFGKRGRTL